MTIYVKGKSKKAINEAIAAGRTVWGVEYSMFNSDSHVLDATLPNGTAIKIFEAYSGGNPTAKSYGTWDAKRGIIK